MAKKLLRSSLRGYGGKGLLKYKLLPLFLLLQDYRIYIEPFGGGASLLFAKEISPIEVYNDLNSGLVNLFRGISGNVSGWLSIIDLLPKIHLRLKHVRIENKDWREIFQYYDSEDAFFYVDPPYVHSTRKTKNNYLHEMSDSDHQDLIQTLLFAKGKIMLTGYANEIYSPLDISNRWVRHDLSSFSHISQDKGIECVWMNY